ncbi:nitrogenase cofactor biosynthesis protein NifB [Desulfurivibrio sp. D14AmB]|uniref:nitrogenase cofactor biosynthesis protein NifB n=1 Tax=Desulfurivibrio sp. D14AmB TaxID=3374370 RepID=UPI00376EDC68
MKMTADRSQHPCFNPAVKGQFGRVHLPVAPNCNIKCNYCNRKYDCVNESRPGVTSTVLSPEQALVYLDRVLEQEPRIKVVGIAGPGDPFANADETMETLRLISEKYPQMLLCLASNGMNIGPHIAELAALNVSHVTITVNAVDPEIGAQIYSWVRDGKVLYRGRQAAELLLSRQLAAISKLKLAGITVKINCIMVPGINDHHITTVAEAMRDLGADLFNCMALFPNAGTPFAGISEPSKQEIAAMRSKAEEFLPQMRHCTRCRADAVGLLDQDRTEQFRGCLSACATLPPPAPADRPYVAVASMEGILVNQHLGEAEHFQIFARQDGQYRLLEQRPAPPRGGGVRRWISLARILNDCRAVLVSGAGETPREILREAGLRTVEMNGFINEGLKAIYEGGNPALYKTRKVKSCSAGGCQGSGAGCG